MDNRIIKHIAGLILGSSVNIKRVVECDRQAVLSYSMTGINIRSVIGNLKLQDKGIEVAGEAALNIRKEAELKIRFNGYYQKVSLMVKDGYIGIALIGSAGHIM